MKRVSRVQVSEQLPALLRYARALTRDPAAAEDLAHDALVLAYARLGSFRRGRSLRVWLFAILHNRFISDRRRAATQTRAQSEIELRLSDSVAPSQEAVLRLRELDAAITTLPDEQRAALHLVGVEGLSYEEAAAALDVPTGTLMSRLSRARARLREIDDGVRGRPSLRLVGQRGAS